MFKNILYKTNYESPLGNIIVTCDDNSLIGLRFDKYCTLSSVKENSDLEIFKLTKNWLDKYFAGENPRISELPVALQGSDFTLHVWRIICKIPYGNVMTYGDIAKIIAKEKGKEKISPQAVGRAAGHNPILIVIPCHRVIGSNGELKGYSGGIDLKIKLLNHEGAGINKRG